MSKHPEEVPQEPGRDAGRDQFLRMIRGEQGGDDEIEIYGLTVHGLREINPDEMRRILAQAIGGIDQNCPQCDGEFCPHREIQYRDAFLKRAFTLTAQMQERLAVYMQLRALGVSGCEELQDGVYRLWHDLAYLFDAAEPQEWFTGRAFEGVTGYLAPGSDRKRGDRDGNGPDDEPGEDPEDDEE